MRAHIAIGKLQLISFSICRIEQIQWLSLGAAPAKRAAENDKPLIS
jgi:hypothetical protein